MASFEVVAAEEMAKRQMEKATSELKGQLDALKKETGGKNDENRRMTDLWRDGRQTLPSRGTTRRCGPSTLRRAAP